MKKRTKESNTVQQQQQQQHQDAIALPSRFESSLAAGGCITMVAASIYLTSLYPSVPGGDSGELMAVACNLGMAHPPGYPTLTLLGHLWLKLCGAFVEIVSPSWALNALAAVMSAIAAGLLTLTVCRITSDMFAGLISGAIYAFSPLAWKYSTQFEVFALNQLIVALLMFLTTEYLGNSQYKENTTISLLGAFVCGIGLTNQHTIILFESVWILMIFARGKVMHRFWTHALVFLLGLSFYGYLIVRSPSAPIGSWGDCASWRGFWKHLTRKEYGSFRLYISEDVKPDFVGLSVRWLEDLCNRQYGIAMTVAAVASCFNVVNRKQILSLWMALLAYIAVFHSLANLPNSQFFFEIQQRFWLQSNIVVAALIGCGVCQLWSKSDMKSPYMKGALLVAIISIQWSSSWTERHQQQNGMVAVKEFALMMLSKLPENAIVVTTGDLNYFPTMYVQQCEHFRSDVQVLNTELLKGDWFPQRQQQWYSTSIIWPKGEFSAVAAGCEEKKGFYNLHCFLSKNLANNRIFTTEIFNKTLVLGEEFEERPFGLLWEVKRKKEQPISEAEVDEIVAAMPSCEIISHCNVSAVHLDSWEKSAITSMYKAVTAQNVFLISQIRSQNDHSVITNLVKAGVSLSELLLNNEPKAAILWKNDGALFQHLMNTGPLQLRCAFVERMVKSYEKYLSLADPKDDKAEMEVLGEWCQRVRASLTSIDCSTWDENDTIDSATIQPFQWEY